MGDKTGIEWTDATWNPVTGCDRTSPGCDNCYALTMAGRLKRMGSANYQNDGDPRTSGPGFGVTCHPHMLDQPLRWRRPRRIFVNSMSDLFHPSVPDEFIVQVFAVMAVTPRHTFQLLTKRPQRMAALLADDGDGWSFVAQVEAAVMEMVDQGVPAGEYDGLLPVPGSSTDELLPWPLANVWLGVSIESDRYTFRADHLRATPAAVRWISAEPLLGPLPSLNLTGIDWLVAGGESGPGARPMHPDWVRDLRDRCERSGGYCDDGLGDECCDTAPHPGTAFLFKQWGEWHPWGQRLADGTVNLLSKGEHPDRWREDGPMVRVGKRDAGRELDGRTWDEYPEVGS